MDQSETLHLQKVFAQLTHTQTLGRGAFRPQQTARWFVLLPWVLRALEWKLWNQMLGGRMTFRP
jgi:hypothetical protein